MLDIKVFAVDPGITTGMAFYNPYAENNNDNATIWTDEAKNDDEVLGIALEFDPDVVVVERFATSGQISKYGLSTVELVGALYGLSYCMRQNDYARGKWEFVRQTPQSRRSFMQDAIEHNGPSLHGRSTHKGRHERDALAHLLEYVWKAENGRV